jgi:predicted dehydrogenase
LSNPITDLTQVTPGTPAWNLLATKAPENLDYNTWIGPSRMEAYIAARSHKNWRWNYNTGGGQLMDWIGHHCDIAHWGLGFDRSGPSEIEAHGDFPATNAVWNTSPKYRVEALYKQAVTGYNGNVSFTIAGGYPEIRSGVKWIGTDGWVWVDRGGFDASNPAWKKGKSLPEELRKQKLYVSANHWQNFLDCIKTRKPTITPVQIGHHSALPGHLGYISMITGRKLNWDVANELIIGDPEAEQLTRREYRAPYKIA